MFYMHKTQKCSKISYDILWDSEHILYEGVLYFQNIIQFHGTLENMTLVGMNFLPVKNLADLYRFEVAGSKYGNQITPSLTIFDIEALKVKKIHLY
jgi:hypothetical protein